MKTNDALATLEVKADARSHFAWLRTRMSTDRTLEAWIRTAISLIGFGFTIVQFFARLNQMEGVAPARDPHLPQYMGLVLIGIGTVALMTALCQHRLMVKHLHRAQFRPLFGTEGMPGYSPTWLAGIALCWMGIAAFGATLYRMVIR